MTNELKRGSLNSVLLRDFALTFKGIAMPPGMERWMRGQRCVNCTRNPASDLHHFLGSTQGMKSADIFRVPVCRECHTVRENDPTFRDDCIVEWCRLVALFIADDYASRETTPSDNAPG